MSPNAPATAASIPAARPGTAPAAVRTASLHKTYGSGDNAVHALDGVDVEFAAGRSLPSWARPAPASRP